MDGPGVRDADGELVEVRAGMDALGADRGERGLEAGGAGGALGGDVAQPVRPDRREIDARGEGEQRLVRADVAGGLVAPDVLLARAERHHERPLAPDVGRHPDEAAGDLADEPVGRGEDPEVRAAVLRRDPERLALAGRDVRAVGAGRREDRERDGLDDADEQGARRVGEPADLGHRLEEAEEARLGRDHAGDRRSRRPAAARARRDPSSRRRRPRSTSGIVSSSSPPPK